MKSNLLEIVFQNKTMLRLCAVHQDTQNTMAIMPQMENSTFMTHGYPTAAHRAFHKVDIIE